MFDELAAHSWTVQKNWLSPPEVESLRRHAIQMHERGHFRNAGIGRERVLENAIRGDQIHWLSPDKSPILTAIWQRFEDLRLQLNQELFLGCDHFELHFAVYQPGQFYQAHLDQSHVAVSGAGSRVISAVLYLNLDWQENEAGELILLENLETGPVMIPIFPNGGTLLMFRSDTILHEVRSPRRERWSLTGWFRRS